MFSYLLEEGVIHAWTLNIVFILLILNIIQIFVSITGFFWRKKVKEIESKYNYVQKTNKIEYIKTKEKKEKADKKNKLEEENDLLKKLLNGEIKEGIQPKWINKKTKHWEIDIAKIVRESCQNI